VVLFLWVVVAVFIFLSKQEKFYTYIRSKLDWQADLKGYLEID